MSLTIVLSGPASVLAQAKSALTNAGFIIQGTGYDWGLQDTPDTDTFITVNGDDINAANTAVESLGWRLRTNWPNDDDGGANVLAGPIAPNRPDIHDQVAELRRELEQLKAGR